MLQQCDMVNLLENIPTMILGLTVATVTLDITSTFGIIAGFDIHFLIC
jgi:hypothetical protein